MFYSVLSKRPPTIAVGEIQASELNIGVNTSMHAAPMRCALALIMTEIVDIGTAGAVNIAARRIGVVAIARQSHRWAVKIKRLPAGLSIG